MLSRNFCELWDFIYPLVIEYFSLLSRKVSTVVCGNETKLSTKIMFSFIHLLRSYWKQGEYELFAMLQITEVLPVPDLYKEALIPRLAHLCYFCLTTPPTVAEKASLIRKAICCLMWDDYIENLFNLFTTTFTKFKRKICSFIFH